MGRMFYAVKVGRVPGVYRKQKDALDQVRDFSRGEWLRFSSEQEAEEYLRSSLCSIDYEWLIREKNKKKYLEKVSYKELPLTEELKLTEMYSSEFNTLAVYTDGSGYKHYAAYSAVIVENNKVIHQISGIKKIREQRCSSLIAEIFAVKTSISYAIEQKKEKIVVFHDLSTLGLAAYGSIHVHTPYYREYQQFIQSALPKIDILFIKVKGHRQNPFNIMADQLAKELSIKKKGTKKR